MQPTAANLIRWAGLAAMASGILFVVMQPIHPADVLSSVTTDRWAIVHYLGVAMGFFGLLGVAGLYARQADKVGWLGLAGYLLLSLFYALTLAFQFIEAFVSPRLATASPAFVEGLLGIANGHATGIDLGALPTVYDLTGGAYLLGGLLLGIATFRARILPRWTGILLAAAVPVAPVAVQLLPHAIERYAAVPMGVALACLGYTLWSERRAHAAEPVLGRGSPQLRPAGAD
ncbi:MAG TPA: hypothetical protein VHK63_08830 [Candidatus Limnocylindria bacterium]|nr:hypothetical protein [Candidatus Limnocylindria bacterium]